MDDMTYEFRFAEPGDGASRPHEALKSIMEICDAVNYPPDMIVRINCLARQGIGAPPPASSVAVHVPWRESSGVGAGQNA